MIRKFLFKGSNAIKLENDVLQVIVLPDIGGKIASIFSKDKEFEILFQNKENIYRKPSLGDSFAEFDASGFDDAFPTIDTCIVKYEDKEIEYPDHGEVWLSTFSYEIIRDYVRLWFRSSILPYEYEKIIRIYDQKLKIHYNIRNYGTTKFPCIWAMHCLLRCEENMVLNFPPGIQKIMNVQKSSKLGDIGAIHSFPVTVSLDGQSYRLDRVLPSSAMHKEKYYVDGIILKGICGVYYPSKNVRVEIKFDKNKLPYLGFWVTEGSFRGDYNCSFEPTNCFYDSIPIAMKNNRLFYLKKGENIKFEIEISIK